MEHNWTGLLCLLAFGVVFFLFLMPFAIRERRIRHARKKLVGVEKEQCSVDPCDMGCFYCRKCGMPDYTYHLETCQYAQGLTE